MQLSEDKGFCNEVVRVWFLHVFFGFPCMAWPVPGECRCFICQLLALFGTLMKNKLLSGLMSVILLTSSFISRSFLRGVRVLISQCSVLGFSLTSPISPHSPQNSTHNISLGNKNNKILIRERPEIHFLRTFFVIFPIIYTIENSALCYGCNLLIL